MHATVPHSRRVPPRALKTERMHITSHTTDTHLQLSVPPKKETLNKAIYIYAYIHIWICITLTLTHQGHKYLNFEIVRNSDP